MTKKEILKYSPLRCARLITSNEEDAREILRLATEMNVDIKVFQLKL